LCLRYIDNLVTATDPTDYSTLPPRIPPIIPPYRHWSNPLFHLTATGPSVVLLRMGEIIARNILSWL